MNKENNNTNNNIFESFGLSENLLKAIKRLGYSQPTEIQEMSIPHIIQGEDLIGESATGSGKTLAFGCGIIDKTMPGKGLQSLVLTPTRELAEQVKNSLIELSGQKLKIIAVYGGVSINPQIEGLLKADVVVGTPGRLLDHLNRRTIDTKKVKILILDEADRMLDMGFIEDVEQIIRTCPRDRQTLFFSATIPDSIKELSNMYMKSPVNISAKKHVDPSKLEQVYYDVEKNMKLSLLVHLLEEEKSGLVMIFCNTRRTTDFVHKNLQANGIRSIVIHGGLSQNRRIKTINMFNDARVSILVCTDVAARGLHIDNVSHVYNYEIPKDAKEYIHRIGRTARAGADGKAISLLSNYDYQNFSRILDEYPNFSIESINVPYVKKVRVEANILESRSRGQFRNRRY